MGLTVEPLREMASALVDGEASEFELRRLLAEASAPEVRGLLSRHYAVRSVLRREAPLLSPPELTRSILQALAAEPVTRAAGAVPSWRGWFGKAAIAASVCAVTVLGGRAILQSGIGPAASGTGTALAALGQPARPAAPLANGSVTVGLRPSLVDDADGVARERLQMYMLEHAGNAALNTPEGMLPYARVVSWEEP